MAAYGSVDKLGDKKVGIPSGTAIPPAYGYATAPTFAAAPPLQAHYNVLPPGYAYPQGPPPPYSVAVNQPATSVPGYAYASYGYPYGVPVYSQPTMAPGPPTVVMPGGYDAGARFDGIARGGMPPPPPGVMPNAAQLAMLQGGNAVVTQQKGSFLSGGSDGGYTFW